MCSGRFRVIFILRIFFISLMSLILKIFLKPALNSLISARLGLIIVRSLTYVLIIIFFLLIKIQGSEGIR
jgi:hypothetical protein